MSRKSFYRQRLEEATGNQGSQWKIVRELLHTDDQRKEFEPAEAERLCWSFSKFFADKLRRIAGEIKTRLSTSVRFAAVRRTTSSVALEHFSTVTVDEVVRVIKLLPPKSSPLDCLPVSLLKAAVDVTASTPRQLVIYCRHLPVAIQTWARHPVAEEAFFV